MAAVDALTLFLGALYSFNVLPVVSVERPVYYQERSTFSYHSLPYAMAQSTVELPYMLVQACVYSCIVYWCCGFELNAGEPASTVFKAVLLQCDVSVSTDGCQSSRHRLYTETALLQSLHVADIDEPVCAANVRHRALLFSAPHA